MYRIVRKEALRPTVTLYEIEAPLIAKKAQPGQFIILRVDENGRIGLFEADGGVWKLEAKQNVKEYLAVELDDLVKSGQVVVMM